MSSSLKIRSEALYIFRSSRSSLLPHSVSDIDAMLNSGKATSAAVIGRRELVGYYDAGDGAVEIKFG